MNRLFALALLALAVGGCGGTSVVAHVDGTEITRKQLDETVQHFKDEAEAEGRSFPERDTTAYRTVERQALGLLVYRTELVASAVKLGVPVTNAEVEERTQAAGEEATEGGAFARDTVRAQIAYEHVYAEVTAGLSARGQERAIRRWLARMQRDYEVSYEAGFGPAS